MLLGCCYEDRQQRNAAISSKQTTTEETGHYLVNKPTQPTRAEFCLCKWSSFRSFPLTITGEFTSTGSGLRLIPVVLPVRVAEHILCKIKSVSLSANSPSQNSSFYLSISIAIITGDYRHFSYTAKTPLVSLLGYSSAILYSSYVPLLLSGPSISNPPTSNSFNYLITSLGPLPPIGTSRRPKQSYLKTDRRPKQSNLNLIQVYPIAVIYIP